MINSPTEVQDLVVRGESLEKVFNNYTEGRYLVNRRYQRKLIWTLEEKVKFIDSIAKGFPVPIILLAENKNIDKNCYEIIDGMQRLNAITSFIENQYMVNGYYFDLNTMAITKSLFDKGIVAQREPVLDRDICVKMASYVLPLSIYEFINTENVDEVFRRINSGGKKLSRQELRAAGSTGYFAQAVRRMAAKIRGDDSRADILKLNDMQKISITNKDLSYGIDVDKVFWVSQNIITKDQLRQSKDEELVADIVAYMVMDGPQSSRSEYLDDFFGLREDQSSKSRFIEIESAVQRRTVELVIKDFQRTLDSLKIMLFKVDKSFGQLLFSAQPSRAPRYFQAVFLAFYDLVVLQGMEISDYSKLGDSLRGSGSTISIPEGGRWGAEQRQRTINSVMGIISPSFRKTNLIDPATIHWITQLQNILSQSYTEQSAYDFKQGFLRVDPFSVFDEENFEKILKTCVGVSNIKKGNKGYVLVGVADKLETAERVKSIFGVDYMVFEGFFITGIDHEAIKVDKNLDQFFQYIIEKIKSSLMSIDLKDYIARNIKPVRYYDKTVFVFEVEGQEDPSSYDGIYYIRHGANLYEIKHEELPGFFRRYLLG